MNGPERGSATVIHLALIVCLVVIALALGVHVSRGAARSHVTAVADLAALAAAQARGCAAAEAVVHRNGGFGADLRRCEYSGGFAQVYVLSAPTWAVGATSRAGPAW